MCDIAKYATVSEREGSACEGDGEKVTVRGFGHRDTSEDFYV